MHPIAQEYSTSVQLVVEEAVLTRRRLLLGGRCSEPEIKSNCNCINLQTVLKMYEVAVSGTIPTYEVLTEIVTKLQ